MFNRHLSRFCVCLVPAVLLFAAAGQALADPPSRVARLSYTRGDVSMQPAGIQEWSEARLNRPLITGDSLYTDRASRAEMEVGAATLRLDERSSFRLLNLDDSAAQVELTAGTLNLTVRQVYEGQTYEVDTPTLALVIDQPGEYRIDIAPKGESTMVSVIDGDGEVYGRDNASFQIRQGESYRFYDSQLKDYEVLDLPRQDDFDQWCSDRADRYARSPSRRYVSEDTIGYADLDEYGSWSSAASYGSIWYPTRVDAGWTPYRNGHWSWIDPWGWTWVDDQPWGFAPSHYGRWAYVGSRWGWVPGPRNVRSIYAPALVAFVGGGGFSVSISSGGPVGWFPLGPSDVYVPWYQGSRNYFNNINSRNTTIINNTYISNVYNDYSRGQTINNFDYAYRNDQRAYTAVSRDTFINARSVERSRVQVNQSLLAQGRVVSRIEVAPTARSFVGGGAARGDGGRNVQRATFDRQVIARTAPPARRLDAQERIRAISRNDNQPLAVAEMRELSASRPNANARQARRVEVVGGNRPASTATPIRSRDDTNSRSTRSNNSPSRVETNSGRTPENSRIERGRDGANSNTVRAPRVDNSERTSPSVQPRTAIDREQRSDRSASPRQPVERDNSSRTISAPEQRRPATIRANPQAVERNREETGRGQGADRQPRREIQQREAAPQQERREMQQREAAPQQERREIQQRQPAPQQERREIQQRQPAPQQERREMQPRPTPQLQQAPVVQQRQPVQKPQQRKAREKDDSDDKDNNQRNRRESD
ncbi:MAG: DUF6600 domain-containing protein [Dokdonella sp.]